MLNILSLTECFSVSVIILAVQSLVFLFNLDLVNKIFASIFMTEVDKVLKAFKFFLKTESCSCWNF